MSAVAVVTSTRAEWGLLRPFAEALIEVGVEVRVVVTGTHLADDFGLTIREVESSGLPIDASIPILGDGDGPIFEARTMANALRGFSDYFSRRRPDAVLILGDRYEMLAIAEAAFLFCIPIIHLHGGEKTEGAIDDCLRHCITKLSSLHLVCADEYADRVIQMGEVPESVYNVGAIGVQNAMSLPLMGPDELFSSLGLKKLGEYLLLTYHPVTLGDGGVSDEIRLVLEALENTGLEVIATRANADAGGVVINEVLESYAQTKSFLHLFSSLGSLRYLSAMKNAIAVVGNSSSGILEAPALRVPTVNIGPRQDGRIRADSVIDCALDVKEIVEAVEKARSASFRGLANRQELPFGNGNVSRPAARIIAQHLREGFPASKSFFDIEFEVGERH